MPEKPWCFLFNASMLARSMRCFLLICLLAIRSTAHAGIGGPLEQATYIARAVSGPLALSSDGRYRFHVDTSDVMHRVDLAGREAGLDIELGVHAVALASSATGNRVVVVTPRGCLGIVHLATRTAHVSWASTYDAGYPDGPWTASPAAKCIGEEDQIYGSRQALALSADGRLLAWGDAVMDLDSNRLIARLPLRATTLQFVDGDRKLLAAFIASGYRYEEESDPDSLRMMTWDLATGELHGVMADGYGERVNPLHLFATLSPATGVAWWVDTSRYRTENFKKDDQLHTMVRLMSVRPGICGTPALRGKLIDADGEILVIDPLGRWAATVAYLGRSSFSAFDWGSLAEYGEHTPRPGPDGSALTFFDLATGRPFRTINVPSELHGVAVSVDGMNLHAVVTPVRARTPSSPNAPTSGDAQAFAVPSELLAKPRDGGMAWKPGSCPIEDELPGARRVSESSALLPVAWTRPLDKMEGLRPRRFAAPTAMARPDGSVWLMRPHDLAQLDAATGEVVRTMPLPGEEGAARAYLADSDGFISAEGDTLNWRSAQRPGDWRRIDSRTHWKVKEFDVRGRVVLVEWAPASLEFLSMPSTYGTPSESRRKFVLYDLASGQLLSEAWGDVGASGATTWDELTREQRRYKFAACHDDAGELLSGFDWRTDLLGSVRVWRCQSQAARTTFWAGTTLNASASAPAGSAQEVLDVAGALGAVSTAAGLVRVFDASTRHEIGRIALKHTSDAATLAPAAHLVLVESDDTLTAYRLP